MKAITRIIPTLKGHTIVLEIGNQSFEMKEYLGDSIMTSEQRANWFKEQLDQALNKLTK